MKKYIAPQLTVVEFKVERGYASSLDFEPQSFDLMTLAMDINGDGTPDQNLENYQVLDGTGGHANWGDIAADNHFF